jgi:hypothetical protein
VPIGIPQRPPDNCMLKAVPRTRESDLDLLLSELRRIVREAAGEVT